MKNFKFFIGIIIGFLLYPLITDISCLIIGGWGSPLRFPTYGVYETFSVQCADMNWIDGFGRNRNYRKDNKCNKIQSVLNDIFVMKHTL